MALPLKGVGVSTLELSRGVPLGALSAGPFVSAAVRAVGRTPRPGQFLSLLHRCQKRGQCDLLLVTALVWGKAGVRSSVRTLDVCPCGLSPSERAWGTAGRSHQ